MNAKGCSIRHIDRTLGVNRRTVKRYAMAAAPKYTTQVTTGSRSLCSGFREVIAPMLELGLSAQRIYQDLVSGYGFGGSYPSVRRYVAMLKASEPQRVWRIECQPGEEMQVADKRVHGTTRRQVAAVFEEERKALGPLPASVYESYQEGPRRVQHDSFVEVAKAYYEAPPEFIGRQLWVRWDGRMVRLLNDRMEQVGCHARLEPGKFSRCLGVRGLHGTIKESADYWHSRAAALGEAAGRWARRSMDACGAKAIRSIMGLYHLAEKRRASDINTACAKSLILIHKFFPLRTA